MCDDSIVVDPLVAARLPRRASFPVHTYEVDAFGMLEVPALSGYLQEVAGLHAAELGVGIDLLRAKGLAWVLARQRIEVPLPVMLGDTLEIEILSLEPGEWGWTAMLPELGLLPDDFHLLATSTAVIGGLTYNYLPFMVLPLYVALERVDPSLVEAAHDLFASRASAFRRVVFPLSLPGVFAGVLITFVPVASDFVNSGILGGTQTTMIGNVIQTVYLNSNDYPLASAMSFLLMAALLVGIFTYARALGTEQVMEVSRG